jgi:hypothetical protein
MSKSTATPAGPKGCAACAENYFLIVSHLGLVCLSLLLPLILLVNVLYLLVLTPFVATQQVQLLHQAPCAGDPLCVANNPSRTSTGQASHAACCFAHQHSSICSIKLAATIEVHASCQAGKAVAAAVAMLLLLLLLLLLCCSCAATPTLDVPAVAVLLCMSSNCWLCVRVPAPAYVTRQPRTSCP